MATRSFKKHESRKICVTFHGSCGLIFSSSYMPLKEPQIHNLYVPVFIKDVQCVVLTFKIIIKTLQSLGLAI